MDVLLPRAPRPRRPSSSSRARRAGAARYYTTIVFLVAGVLLLPAGLVALLGVVQHIPEWLKMRYPWYIQTFNIVNYTADCLVAWFAAHLVLQHGQTAREPAAVGARGRSSPASSSC